MNPEELKSEINRLLSPLNKNTNSWLNDVITAINLTIYHNPLVKIGDVKFLLKLKKRIYSKLASKSPTSIQDNFPAWIAYRKLKNLPLPIWNNPERPV